MNDPTGVSINTPDPQTGHRPRLTRAERRERDAAAKVRTAETLDKGKRARRARAEEDKRRKDAAKAFKSSQSRDAWRARLARWRDTLVLVGAIVGVNVVAIVGQVAAFHDDTGFGWSLPVALGAAAVVETIAIYVGWHAHTALVEGDSVAKLRGSSYVIALIVGGLNYAHYAGPGGSPTEEAVMFGMASVLSPWLWSLHSRHQHRRQLRAAGLIDPRAPKFSALRWILHRDETWQALKWAVRFSEQSPVVAILAIQTDDTTTESVRLLDRARAELAVGQTALIRAQSDAIAATEMCVTELEKALAEVSSQRADDDRDSEKFDDHRNDDNLDSNDDADSDQGSDRERPDEQDNRKAEKWIRACMREGRTPRQRDIATKYGFSNGWAALRVKAARGELSAQGYRFLPGNVVQPPAGLTTVNGSQSVHADAIPMTAVEVS